MFNFVKDLTSGFSSFLALGGGDSGGVEEDGRLTTAFCSAASTLTVCKEDEEEEDEDGNGRSAEDLTKQVVIQLQKQMGGTRNHEGQEFQDRCWPTGCRPGSVPTVEPQTELLPWAQGSGC